MKNSKFCSDNLQKNFIKSIWSKFEQNRANRSAGMDIPLLKFGKKKRERIFIKKVCNSRKTCASTHRLKKLKCHSQQNLKSCFLLKKLAQLEQLITRYDQNKPIFFYQFYNRKGMGKTYIFCHTYQQCFGFLT